MRRLTQILARLIGIVAITTTALAGDLNPPAGPVVATGRFGPRTEINAANTPGDADSLFKITQPGSYYLGGNVAVVSTRHGIEIAASGVTLDLSGFELLGNSRSLDGITLETTTNLRDIEVRNGTIRGWAGDGVDLSACTNARLADIRSSGNGGRGFFVGLNAVVTGCVAWANGNNGFTMSTGVITDCAAYQNMSFGIVGSALVVRGCQSLSNGSAGIFSSSGVISECESRSDGSGIFMAGTGVVSSCAVSFSGANGIVGGNGSLIIGNSVRTCVQAGIEATALRVRIEGNTVSNCDRGISANQINGNCVVVRNTAIGNITNYDNASGNHIGTIRVSVVGAGAWDNFSF